MSRVLVVSGGHIDNTKLFIDGVQKDNIEEIWYQIDRQTKIGILTVIYFTENEGIMQYEERHVSAFNDEEDDIQFVVDGEIPGSPISDKPQTLSDWQRKYKDD